MSNARARVAEIAAKGAPMELSLTRDERGARLVLRGRSLSITTRAELVLAGETLRVEARGSASLQVGGALEEQVAGEVRREAVGDATLAASGVAMRAEEAIALRANDDVTVRGRAIELAPERRGAPLEPPA